MSKYTVQLRWLVQQYLTDIGADNVEANWPLVYAKLGLSDYPIFEEAYRETLNGQIIRHYWMYEIGAETAGLFKWYVRDTMHLIMPYYNQMYSSLAEAKKITPFEDQNVTTSTKRTKTVDANGQSTSDSNNSADSIYSDTPQNSLNLENIKNGQYATTANFDSASGHGTGEYFNHDNENETYERTNVGYSKSQSELLLLWRQTFVNIDFEIVRHPALRECFMEIW